MFKDFIKISFFCLLSLPSFCQEYADIFGKNRIQHKEFNWSFYRTENFDVYYYPESAQYAKKSIDFLEDEFLKLSDALGYIAYEKMKILIYTSIHDLQQSNIGVQGQSYTIGGETDFVHLSVQVDYPGTLFDFRQKLKFQLAYTLIQDMMFGGNLIETLQSNYLLTLPNWFIEGAARYLTYGWSSDMDDMLQSYLSKHTKPVNVHKLDARIAPLIGQSIWNFIALEYGSQNIPNILNITSIIRKEKHSISNVLGVPFDYFMTEWRRFYSKHAQETSQSYLKVDKSKILKKIKKNQELIASSVQFNNDATKMAYATIKDGIYNIYVLDFPGKKTKKIASGGIKIINQKLDKSLPLLDWKDKETLGAIAYKRGKLYLNTFNLSDGEKKEKSLSRFSKIQSFSFNENGKLIIISADMHGQNDLFLTSMTRSSIRRITRDIYDDIDPVFIPGSSAIVFSSNRENDMIRAKKKPSYNISGIFNLFLFDLDTSKVTYQRLTNTYSKDHKPYVKNHTDIYYLSDQKGMHNLFKYDLSNNTFSQITKYDRSILAYDLNFNPNRIAFIMFDHKENNLYFEENINLNTNKFTPQNARKTQENKELIRIKKEKKLTQEIDQHPPVDADEKFEDPNNFVFEEENEISENNSNTFFQKLKQLKVRKKEKSGPHAYEPKFSINNLVSSFLWDPYRNFMLLAKLGIDEMFENIKLRAGGLFKLDFVQGDLFVEADYLKYKTDFSVKYERKVYAITVKNAVRDLYQRYRLNQIQFSAKHPLLSSLRVQGSTFFTVTEYHNLNYISVRNEPSTNYAPNSKNHYLGISASIVFDDAVNKNFNLYHGTKGIFEVSAYNSIDSKSKNFSKFKLDIRHHENLWNNITWSSRVMVGSFLGNSKKKYLLGGMNNWAFPKKEGDQDKIIDNPLRFSDTKDLSDIFFNEFATNLRGLNMNTAYGNNTILLNTELRFPLFHIFSKTPTESNFIRNLQLIAFFDMGTVWNGKFDLFAKKKITKIYRGENNPFSAEILQYQNPWIKGSGFGLRTVIFDYFIKMDVARSRIDNQWGTYNFYFSLGLDF